MSKKITNQFICSRMMLPEHKEKLNSHRKSILKKEKYSKPCFDEQRLEEFQFLLNHSMHNKITVKITVLNDNEYLNIEGIVKKMDLISRKITLITEEELKIIDSKSIVDIKPA
jgi:hypothetical protein